MRSKWTRGKEVGAPAPHGASKQDYTNDMDTVNDICNITLQTVIAQKCSQLKTSESRPVLTSRSVVQSVASVTLQERQSVIGQRYKWNFQPLEIPTNNKQTQTNFRHNKFHGIKNIHIKFGNHVAVQEFNQ